MYARSKIFQFLFFFSFYRLSKRIIDPTNFRSTGFSKVTLPKIRERRFHVRRCYLLRSESFPSVERDNGTMAGREKGLISSRHILIYAVNLIRQRGSLCNASFHSSKLPRKAGSRRIDTRSWRVYVYEKRACLGQVVQLEFAASWFFRIACKWITRESLKQMPWRYELTTSQLSSIARFSFQREPLQVKEST